MRLIASSSNGILIVEDDLDIFEIIKLYLHSEGYKVFHAINEEETELLLNQNPVSLVLLDLQLPDASGFDICVKIRKTFDVPIIFLSGRTEEKIVKKGLELGANDYMFKPFIPNELMAKIRNYTNSISS